MKRKQHKMRQAIVAGVLAFSLAFGMATPAFAAFSADDKAKAEEAAAQAKAELIAAAEELQAYVAENQDEWYATGLEWADYVAENYDEWYAEGFKYADENGYIDTTMDALAAAVDALEDVDIDATEATDEFKAEFKAAVAAIKR